MDKSLSSSAFDVLLSLVTGPKHGYAMMQAIEELHDGRHKPGPGVLYTTVHKLLEEGLIVEVASALATPASRRTYALTSSGQTAMQGEVQRRTAFMHKAQAALGGQ